MATPGGAHWLQTGERSTVEMGPDIIDSQMRSAPRLLLRLQQVHRSKVSARLIFGRLLLEFTDVSGLTRSTSQLWNGIRVNATMLRPMAAPSPQSLASHFLHFGAGVSFRQPNGRALTCRIYFHTYAADNSCHQRRRPTKKSKHESQLPEVRCNGHWFQMSKLNGIILTAQKPKGQISK